MNITFKIREVIKLKTFYKFVCVGSAGFIVDASIFFILINIFNGSKDLLLSSLFKAISFIIAVFITYLGNYFFTFKNQIIRRTSTSLFFKYLSGQCIGWLTNFTTYILSNNLTDILIQRIIIASFIGMFVNFILSNLIFIKSK